MTMDVESNGPLAGVRVLDAATMIAAPGTAAMLADFGADVVKIEKPGSGDHSRRYGAQKNGISLYWKALGRNKRSVALDLHAPEAQALLLRWLPQFDVFIENFRPGTLERWNLGPDRLLEAAPHLVVLRMTAFGQDGPYRERAGFGTLAEAMTGVAAVSGYDDRPPLLPAFPLADVMAGQAAAAAVCAAYARRLRTGDGEVIDFAIYEAVMKLVESQITEYAANGTLHRRLGNRLEDTAPRGAYRCRDGGYVALSGSTQEVADRVLRTIGGPALAADPRFRTNADRVANGEALDALIDAFCAARSRDDAIEELAAAGCAVGPARVDRVGVRQSASDRSLLARRAPRSRPRQRRRQQCVPALHPSRIPAARAGAHAGRRRYRRCPDARPGAFRRRAAALVGVRRDR